MKNFLIVLFMLFSLSIFAQNKTYETGNVIFIHPDGTGLATWNAVRLVHYGPDGMLNWDKLSEVGLYRGHQTNALSTSSHAGATAHAYGVKVLRDSYGMDGTEELTSLSGKKQSIMQEAISQGIKVGLINSGNIIEPGTGVFVASSESRGYAEEIAEKIIKSGAQVIMSGGEEWLLPKGIEGRYTEGKRTDNKNLITWAEDAGYTVVYNKDELKTLDDNVEKLLGVFGANHTFNDKTEEELKEKNLPLFSEAAPTLAEMTEAALKVLAKSNEQFFLVVEEEGTDNFGNYNNAPGTLEALKRADDAIGVVLDFMKNNPNTLLLTAADSEAGGFEIIGDPVDDMPPNEKLPAKEWNGAPVDGQEGTETPPYMAEEDQYGNKLPFRLAWSTTYDTYGGVIARAEGLNAELMKPNFDNTDVYRMMYATLFGVYLEK